MKGKTRKPRKPTTARANKRVNTALELLERGELVKPLAEADRAFLFKHALVQDTAYASLLKSDQKRLHHLVAETYEAIYATRCVDEFAALLAQHYGQAGDEAKTLAYATHAADQAMNVYALAEAIAFYTQALQVSIKYGTARELDHLLTRRGRAYELNNQYAEALANYQEMEAVGHAREDRSLVLTSLVLRTTLYTTLTPFFDTDQAQQLSDMALAQARELDDRAAQAKIFWNLMLLNTLARNLPPAIAYGEQSLALARELGLREQLALTLNDLGKAYMGAGQMQRVQESLDESRDLWRDLDNLPLLSDNLMMSATLTMLQGNLDQSIAFAEEGRKISHRIGNPQGEFSNQGTLIVILCERGEYARVLELIESALPRVEALKMYPSVALLCAIQGWVFAVLGAFDCARESARFALAVVDQPMPPFFRTWTFSYLARLYVLCGDLTAAMGAIQQTHMGPGTLGFEPSNLFGTLAEGEFALARADFTQASAQMKEYAGRLRQAHIRLGLADVLYLQADGLRAQGETAQALELLKQARTEAEALQARRILWQILARQSEIELQRGNAAEAEACRVQAQAVVEYIVQHSPAEFRSGFLSLPQVQAVMA